MSIRFNRSFVRSFYPSTIRAFVRLFFQRSIKARLFTRKRKKKRTDDPIVHAKSNEQMGVCGETNDRTINGKRTHDTLSFGCTKTLKPIFSQFKIFQVKCLVRIVMWSFRALISILTTYLQICFFRRKCSILVEMVKCPPLFCRNHNSI